MREIQLACRGIVAIAFFCDGERHDVGFRRGQSCGNLRSLIAEENDFTHTANDPSANSSGALFHRGVETVLWHEPVANVGRAQAHAADSPMACLERERIV